MTGLHLYVKDAVRIFYKNIQTDTPAFVRRVEFFFCVEILYSFNLYRKKDFQELAADIFIFHDFTEKKKEIIARFGNEAKTVDASNTLFESISRDLKKKSKMNIDESREYAVNENKINETQIYRSNDILNSLDLMHRICK